MFLKAWKNWLRDTYNDNSGGPAGLVFGYLFVWIGTLSVFSCLSELASMSPTSAGQYYWVSLLSPTSCRKYVSYITGWVTGEDIWLSRSMPETNNSISLWMASCVSLCWIRVRKLHSVINSSLQPKLWTATMADCTLILGCHCIRCHHQCSRQRSITQIWSNNSGSSYCRIFRHIATTCSHGESRHRIWCIYCLQ